MIACWYNCACLISWLHGELSTTQSRQSSNYDKVMTIHMSETVITLKQFGTLTVNNGVTPGHVIHYLLLQFHLQQIEMALLLTECETRLNACQ